MSSTGSFCLERQIFDPTVVSDASRAFTDRLQVQSRTATRWYDVGAAEYRQLRANGTTILPGTIYLPDATDISIPSRDRDRSIPCRILRPQTEAVVDGVLMHVHGGGWCLGDAKSQDTLLQDVANAHNLVCISVGYRLAPEFPFPSGPQDCFDVAEWLVDHAQQRFGAPLCFVGGESAGAHLSLLVVLYMLQHGIGRYSEFRLKGLLLHYGCFSLRWLPSVYEVSRRVPSLVLDLRILSAFRDAFVPGWTDATLDKAELSPLYAELDRLRGKLPPTLFTCGTEDYLLDDTLFMSTRWLVAGGEVTVKIIPGAPYGFMSFPRDTEGSGSAEGRDIMDSFLAARMHGS